MFSSKTVRELIFNLKGRISKILTVSSTLSEDELIALGGIYDTIDSIILWNKTLTKYKATKFKKAIKGYSSLIKNSKRDYIKNHINPMIKKIVEVEWVKKGRDE